jgi:hypothetical protein
MQRMGFTEEKCQEMIDKFKNMTPEEMAKRRPSQDEQSSQGQPMGSGKPDVFGDRAGNQPSINTDSASRIEARVGKISKNSKEAQFAQIENRINTLIEFCNQRWGSNERIWEHLN